MFSMLSRLCVTDCSLIYLFILDTVTGAWELSESCVSQKSGSLETVQPCVLSHVGDSGVSPREIFATYGQICILSHFVAKMT